MKITKSAKRGFVTLFLSLACLANSTLAIAIDCAPLRDASGKIKRSSAAVAQFKRANPCPDLTQVNGRCRGYVVDHIIPLACCGKDAPENMQWQTKENAKAKDKWERKTCGVSD
jgi:hypothetical protein